ncbi:MAG: hypothetical protein QM727_03555 [Niabella sp.]
MQKRIYKAIFDFFVFSNLLLASYAAWMSWYSIKSLDIHANQWFFPAFLFFAVLSVYNLYWHSASTAGAGNGKRINWLRRYHAVHFPLFIVAGLGTLVFLIYEPDLLVWVLPAAIITLIYASPKIPIKRLWFLRRLLWGKTVFLAAAWFYLTTVLPLMLYEKQWGMDDFVFCLNRLLLIFSICVLFDMRDTEYDAARGIKSIPIKLRPQKVKMLFGLCVFICIITALYFLNKSFRQSISLFVPAIIVGLIVPKDIKQKSDYFFYFILDGLMALSPILYLLLGFLSFMS